MNEILKSSSDGGEMAQTSLNALQQTTGGSEHAGDQKRQSVQSWILARLPTFVVLLGLAGAAWIGHRLDWKMPRFSELTGTSQKAEEPWCDAHGVPESICISCKPELMPKGELFGWCKIHGVHECLLEHPQLAQLAEPVQIAPEDHDRASLALKLRPRPENNPSCKMHLRRIQFQSIEAVDRAGIDIALVDRGTVVEKIRAPGEIVYDPTRVAHLKSRTQGSIWRVEKNLGDSVVPGDVLALVDSAEVGQAKSELLQALVEQDVNEKTLNRLTNALDGAVAGTRIIDAETALSKSNVAVLQCRQRLLALGLPLDELDAAGRLPEEWNAALQFLGVPHELRPDIGRAGVNANLLPIVASRNGIVVERDAAVGEVVGREDSLFTIADATRMWVLLNVQLEEAAYLGIGLKFSFKGDGASSEATGVVTWVSTELDPQTRTVTVRGELENPGGHLRNETFGTGEITLRSESMAVLVPDEAVHWEGCCHIAFVRDREYFKEGSYKVFHTRSVRPGIRSDGKTEIIAGLLPGEVVVTRGSGVLRAELLKGNLGAG
jgi:membrane fusion protein, heavy metal efflux system